MSVPLGGDPPISDQRGHPMVPLVQRVVVILRRATVGRAMTASSLLGSRRTPPVNGGEDGGVTMHAEQLHVDAQTVRRLVEAQFPQWRGLQVTEQRTTGTVNAIFRIGVHLAARFPLLGNDPAQVHGLLTVEAEAAHELASAATVPTPEPVAIGEPGAGYPLHWSVQTWVAGHDATVEDPAGSNAFAHDLAELIAALRAADTRGRRFVGVGRGGHLQDHDEWLETCFRRSEDLLDVPLLRRVWAELRLLPEVDEDAMCHRDITPPNVLVDLGRLVGVLDGGGFGPADPALDLVSAWHLLGRNQRSIVRRELGCGDMQWRRGMAWAFQQAMGLVWYYLDSNPMMSRWGMRTLDRIVDTWDWPSDDDSPPEV
jgi:aminoglycoside phosphotransferase (APT) family kinase protein